MTIPGDTLLPSVCRGKTFHSRNHIKGCMHAPTYRDLLCRRPRLLPQPLLKEEPLLAYRKRGHAKAREAWPADVTEEGVSVTRSLQRMPLPGLASWLAKVTRLLLLLSMREKCVVAS